MNYSFLISNIKDSQIVEKCIHLFKKNMQRMNTPLGKQTLALVRSGDYAHPCEEEAIALCFKNTLPDKNRRLLDVGCGRGGSADWLFRNAFGEVTGIDIDGISINLAQQKYKTIKFYDCSVYDIHTLKTETFDIIYHLTSFYAFPDQPAALKSLTGVAGTHTKLIIFDYLKKGSDNDIKYIRREETGHWNPVDPENIGDMLQQSGWILTSSDDISVSFEKWYTKLIKRIEENKSGITALGGHE
jgi:ubiquinone/menaquinone biosynthesis C-methylase UbiE